MNALWTSAEATAATGGRSTMKWRASGVSIDTRTLAKGDLFVALQGDARDGQAFVADAFEKGAAAALVSRHPKEANDNVPLLVVKDTLAGLVALGRASRARANAKIAAVTGSAGKTTTKEMLRLVLGASGATFASAASYNNHWGVPLSLARMPKDTDFAVFEIGMNHEGEIRELVAQVRPQVALVTTVAPAHLEYFGTVEKIADAKAEIFEGVEKGGAALIPGDNAHAERLADHARVSGVERVLFFGESKACVGRLVSVEPCDEGMTVDAEIAGTRHRFAVGAPGRHIATNAVAALLAASELGADVARGAAALSSFAALKGRGARAFLPVEGGSIEMIDESYNANPASMAAAIGLLGAARPAKGGRRLAVLGDMLELGPEGSALHRGLAIALEEARADLVFACGPQMAALWDAVPPARRGAYASQSVELAEAVARAVRPGDVVLIKGSFGSRMATIVDALKARGGATVA